MTADTPADRIEVSRLVPGSAAAVFAVLTRPEQHVAIDGSGTLILASPAKPLAAVGDQFEIEMRQEPLGDYRMRNTVTAFEPHAWLEWAPTHLGHNPIGYRYGYLLRPGPTDVADPTDPSASSANRVTIVTAYYDWSGVSERWRERIAFPGRAEANLAASLANLAGLPDLSIDG
jgi:hypothetical protein